MNSVSDICEYQFVLRDHNTGQGHLRSPGKKVKPKNVGI